MKEAVPNASTVAVLLNPTEQASASEWETMQAASGPLGVRLVAVPVRQVEDLDAAFATARQSGDAIYVVAGQVTQLDRQRVVNLSAQHRLPAMYGFREFTDLGGLMSYGTDIPSMFRRCAGFMDKILKGAKPSELPVEQPTSFDLVVNAKTAAELGITLPESLNARVTEVIR